MKFLPILVTVGLLTVSHAAQDAPALDAGVVLREIEQLEQRQKQTIQQAKQSAMNMLAPGASSGSTASNLYEKAVEATRFDGMKDKVSAFLDWKKAKAELLRSGEMQAALQLHLRYLLLSMERAGAEDGKAFVDPSLKYAAELRGILERLAKEGKVQGEVSELLDKPLPDSVFARWLGLGPWLPKADVWELVPGNYRGILDKNVRSVYREEKSPEIIAVWDMEIDYEARRITEGRLTHQATQFNKVQRPRMMFSRANDMVAVGLKNRGAQEILAIIRAEPSHPDFPNWVKRLRELVTPPAAPETEARPEAPSAPGA
ncbi:MAG: hypothetical protein Fur0032_11440 [Terrimicrobiaceae bacterium]